MRIFTFIKFDACHPYNIILQLGFSVNASPGTRNCTVRSDRNGNDR